MLVVSPSSTHFSRKNSEVNKRFLVRGHQNVTNWIIPKNVPSFFSGLLLEHECCNDDIWVMLDVLSVSNTDEIN